MGSIEVQHLKLSHFRVEKKNRRDGLLILENKVQTSNLKWDYHVLVISAHLSVLNVYLALLSQKQRISCYSAVSVRNQIINLFQEVSHSVYNFKSLPANLKTVLVEQRETQHYIQCQPFKVITVIINPAKRWLAVARENFHGQS